MKIFTYLFNQKNTLFKWTLLLFIFFLSFDLIAVTVKIHGPSEVCPNQSYTFTSEVRNSFGSIITPDCGYAWYVLRNGVVISGPGGETAASFTYTFDNTLGPVEIRLHVKTGFACSAEGSDYKQVRIALKGPSSVSGPTIMCLGETQRFSTFISNNAENCYFHHKYIWTVPSGWTVTSTNPSASGYVDIKAPSTAASGSYPIKVKGWFDNTGWYTPEFTYYVTLGVPNKSRAIIEGPSEACPGELVTFSVSTVSGVTNYQWTWPSNWSYLAGQGTNTLDVAIPRSGFSQGSVSVSLSNKCGKGSTLFKDVINNCGFNYYVSPNPANESFEVNAENIDPKLKNEELDEFEITLFNDKQKIVKSVRTKDRQTKIVTKSLPTGIYYLHVTDKHKTEILQVIIKK